MHGEEGRAELARRSRRPCATVLPMSCSLRSMKTCLPARPARGKRQPAGEGELIADLVERRPRRRAAPPSPRAAATEGTSSATIRRVARIHHAISRAHVGIGSCCTTRLERPAARSSLRLSISSNASLARQHRNLIRDHQRATTELEHLTQRHQRAHRAIRAVGSAAEREHAVLVTRRAAARRARAPAKSSRWCFSAAA